MRLAALAGIPELLNRGFHERAVELLLLGPGQIAAVLVRSYLTINSPNFITSWKVALPVGEKAECSAPVGRTRWRQTLMSHG